MQEKYLLPMGSLLTSLYGGQIPHLWMREGRDGKGYKGHKLHPKP